VEVATANHGELMAEGRSPVDALIMHPGGSPRVL